MQKQYYVLDQNVLRKGRPRNSEIAEKLENAPEHHFVLPDIALVEMTKNEPHVAGTVGSSLKMFAGYENRLHISRGVGECLREELEKRKPIAGMLYEQATQDARALLGQMGNNTGYEWCQYFKSDPDKRAALDGDYFDHDFNKSRLAELIDTFSEEDQKRFRSNRTTRAERLDYIHAHAPGLLCSILEGEDHKWPREKAWDFIRQKPLYLRRLYLWMWLCQEWSKNGNFKDIDGKLISSDLADHDYVITATYFTGLITNENRAIRAYEDLCSLLSKKIKKPQDDL